ncbi:MAG: DEAD/DEAH box helicase [Firmicutes bacterium HGW-Firmicutes-11]|nr:MAG: DEAD/DEAH box helicase [Firmicutes bacterium HGW-Firmicutes-19]PKM84480.1 MAG: DEAD/DEAH box helicase [Firmicutes bacterium HGW-Firmicutes-11]
MKYQPHLYQQMAYDFVMERPASGIFLGVGLGKTVITLTAINDLIYDFGTVKKVLIIATLRVADTVWDSEVAKWDHLKYLKVSKCIGTEAERMAGLHRKADIYLINRENVPWLVSMMSKMWDFDMVVVDELSSFKNPSSKRFKALRKMMPMVSRFIGLTATPAPNGLIDLWPQVYLIDQGERLGKTFTKFRDTYFTPGWRNGHIVYKWNLRPQAEVQIYRAIDDVCMSMKAEDWITVPSRTDIIVPVHLTPQQQLRYHAFEKQAVMEVENDQTIIGPTAAVVAQKLLQFANGAMYDENRKVHHLHDHKLDALDDLIEQANGNPVLVFYNFQHDCSRILERFKDLNIRKLETNEDIQAWNRKEIDVLLAHPASAGHGLNLQAGGNIIIWFGLVYSLELYQQANGRLHRQGQKQQVSVFHILAKNTVDEDVMDVLATKEMGQEKFLAAVKARIRHAETGLM